MQCTNHPNRKAEHICSSCNAPLCIDCAEAVKGGEGYICFQCAMVRSVSEVGYGLLDKQEKVALKEAKQRKQWGPFQYFTVVASVMILVMWGVIIFGGQSPPALTASVLEKGKAGRVLLFMVDGALKRYAYHEGNKYPVHLLELVPKYLKIKKEQVHCLDKLSYKKDTEAHYRLSLADSGKSEMKIILTPKGLEYVQPSEG